MNRLYRAILERRISAEEATLSPRELHHLVKVRRAGSGDQFLGFLEGQGWFLCRLQQSGSVWSARLLEKSAGSPASPLRISLVQALIKKDRFDWVIQKATELGVAEIVPVHTHRSELKLDRSSEKRQRRWQQIVLESVKQCGRDQLPRLWGPLKLSEAVGEVKGSLRFFLDEGGASGLEELMDAHPAVEDCAVFIGPEGGWDDRDREAFNRSKIVGVRLGPRILRAETAPIAIIAILQHRWGDFR